MQEAPGQPNRIRAIRTATGKYAFYFDPRGRAATEYELYDLERDPARGREPARRPLRACRGPAGPSAAVRSSPSDSSVAMQECGTAPT